MKVELTVWDITPQEMDLEQRGDQFDYCLNK
jgi:hypothetical protein